MFMSLIHTQWVKNSVLTGACDLAWKNLTDCVVLDIFQKPDNPFTVISTRIISMVQTSHQTRIGFYIPILCLAFLVMLTNGCVLVTVQSHLSSDDQKTHKKKSQAFKFIASIALADSLIGVFAFYGSASIVAFSLLRDANEPTKVTECLLVNAILFICCFSIQLQILAMTIDRYQCMTGKIGHFFTDKRTFSIILVIWIGALFVGFLPTLGWRTRFNYCFFAYLYDQGYLAMISVVTTINFCAILGMFISMIFKINVIKNGFEDSSAKYQKRYATTVACYAGSYFLTWPPAILYIAITCLSCLANSDDTTMFSMFGLALAGSLARSVIYAVRIQRIHQKLLTWVCNCWSGSESASCNNNRSSGSSWDESINSSIRPNEIITPTHNLRNGFENHKPSSNLRSGFESHTPSNNLRNGFGNHTPPNNRRSEYHTPPGYSRPKLTDLFAQEPLHYSRQIQGAAAINTDDVLLY